MGKMYQTRFLQKEPVHQDISNLFWGVGAAEQSLRTITATETHLTANPSADSNIQKQTDETYFYDPRHRGKLL